MFSSVIAAWADISDALAAGDPAVSEGISWSVTGIVRNINIGYFWMLVNCLASAAYVRTCLILALTDPSSCLGALLVTFYTGSCYAEAH